jgi:micrococcal nuclease
VQVIRVIDGDTLDVGLPDLVHDRPVTRVRLWGIDCPERGRNDEPDEPLADDATALTRSLVQRQIVTLWLEPHRTRGDYGRLLAHVELSDGRVLNEALLADGLARAEDRWPHGRLARYAQVEHSARRQGVGMWSAQ